MDTSLLLNKECDRVAAALAAPCLEVAANLALSMNAMTDKTMAEKMAAMGMTPSVSILFVPLRRLGTSDSITASIVEDGMS